MTGTRIAGLVLAFAFLAGVVGYGVGVRADRTHIPSADSVDVGFLHDMIAHHEQALQLSSEELQRGADPVTKSFAREILLFQAYEIGLMERQLSRWGVERGSRERAMAWMGGASVDIDAMPGLATDDELDVLADTTGAATDALFIALMRDHHAGGVHMAEYAAEHGDDPFVRDLATRMARNQRIEVKEMALARDRAGLSPTPDGYVADDLPDTVHP